MKKQIQFLLLAVGILVIGAFVLFVFNQVAQAYVFATAINSGLGQVVLWSLVLVFAALFAAPVLLYYRLPKALKHPADEAGKAIYLQKLGRRLAKNRLLAAAELDYSEVEGLQRALGLLHVKADEIIQRTAKSVFLTTSISQNGKLDALMVLITNTKMVWNIAQVYYQRPAPRDLIALYANVGTVTFLAAQIEEIDLTEQLEPVIGTVVQNSALKSVPFIGSVSSAVVDSLMEGTINAFLTLRIGVLAKRYCSALEPFEPKRARKAAYREASVMLKSIVVQTSGQVVGALVRATKNAGVNTIKSGVEAAGQATSRMKNILTGWVTRSKNIDSSASNRT
ncbi:MAG: DUF697 domain-containing protein [Bacteroidota bacterium]